MSNRPDTDLVTDALIMALQCRRLDRRVVHHSDRGAIYTPLAFSRRLAERGLAQSFGSTDDAYDTPRSRRSGHPERIQQRLGHHSPTGYESITAVA